MHFSAVITTCFGLAGLVAPSFGAPTYIIGRWTPRHFATGQTAAVAVAAITEPLRAAGGGSSEVAEAEVTAMVVQEASDVRKVENALKPSGGTPPAHDVAFLMDVLQAGDASCGLEEVQEENIAGRGACALEYEQCSTACNAVPPKRFFGWGKSLSPIAGTCQLVCAVVEHGCLRNKRVLHAASAEGFIGYVSARWNFRSADMAKDIFLLVMDWSKALASAIVEWLLLLARFFGDNKLLLLLEFGCSLIQTVHHKLAVLRMRRQSDSEASRNRARIAELEAELEDAKSALRDAETRANEEERRRIAIEDQLRGYREAQHEPVNNGGTIGNKQDLGGLVNGLVNGLVPWDRLPGFLKDPLEGILNRPPPPRLENLIH